MSTALKTSPVQCFLLALVCLFGLGYQSNAVGQPPADQTDASEQEESLEVRYARAHLELAKLDLKRAQYWNRQVSDSVSDKTLAYLQKHVEIDQEQLEQSKQGNLANVHQMYIRGAEASLEWAEAQLARRQRAFKEVGGTLSAIELDRAIAVVNVARLNLERTRMQQDTMHTIAYLQWQLEELRNQVLELQVKVETTPER